MSICSDVYINVDEARRKVKAKLMCEQERLIDSAIKGMDEWDLSSILNRNSDLYYYNIESEESEEEDD